MFEKFPGKIGSRLVPWVFLGTSAIENLLGLCVYSFALSKV